MEIKTAGVRSVYTFDNLDEEAKEKARDWYKEGNDYPFLNESITEYTQESIRSLGYSIEDFEAFYSLSHCQGDGVAFSATLEKDGKTYFVKNGRSNYIASVHTEDEDGNETDSLEVLKEMEKIARDATRAGYEEIANEDSDEVVDDAILANDYTFTSEGKRLDADAI